MWVCRIGIQGKRIKLRSVYMISSSLTSDFGAQLLRKFRSTCILNNYSCNHCVQYLLLQALHGLN
jgi:hypothetical protein